MKRLIPGVGIALPESKIETLRNDQAAYNSSMRNIDGMQRILSKYGEGAMMMSEDDKKAYLGYRARINVPLVKRYAGTALSETEAKNIEPMLATDMTEIVGRQRYNQGQALHRLRAGVEAGNRESMAAHIERPARVGQDPETGRQIHFVSEGVAGPEQFKTGTGGATVLPGAAPGP
jgi:hypothetical protein